MHQPADAPAADARLHAGDAADDSSASADEGGPIDLDGDGGAADAATHIPQATNLHQLAPREQRALLLTHPQRIAAVTHVAPPTHPGDGLLLVVLDGPSNAEVSGLPAPWAGSAPASIIGSPA
jgi:hypothetical protein